MLEHYADLKAFSSSVFFPFKLTSTDILRLPETIQKAWFFFLYNFVIFLFVEKLPNFTVDETETFKSVG